MVYLGTDVRGESSKAGYFFVVELQRVLTFVI